jgi:hypothetical protein
VDQAAADARSRHFEPDQLADEGSAALVNGPVAATDTTLEESNMAQVEVVGDRLVIRLDRADRRWSFRSELQVPLTHIRRVEVDPDQARLPWSGLPVRGDNGWLPGMIAAGQARQDGQWASGTYATRAGGQTRPQH